MLIEVIVEKIAHHYEIPRMQMSEKEGARQMQKVVEAKEIAVYFMWRYTTLTAAQIANILGYRSKGTINLCRNRVKKIMSANKAYSENIELLKSKILRD